MRKAIVFSLLIFAANTQADNLSDTNKLLDCAEQKVSGIFSPAGEEHLSCLSIGFDTMLTPIHMPELQEMMPTFMRIVWVVYCMSVKSRN